MVVAYAKAASFYFITTRILLQHDMKTVYDFTVKDRKGKDVSMKEYANEVLLIVNTATKCGFTPQYDELEKLYEKYHSQGFEILDFPCNQFGQQAPGTDESIHEFCKLNFGTEFPRFKKVKVNGDDAEPLYKFLQEQKGFAGWDMNHKIAPILEDMLSKEDPDYKQKPDIKWNFTKFLINKKGQVVARFEPTENIDNIAKQIEELLKYSYGAYQMFDHRQRPCRIYCSHICLACQSQSYRV